MMERMMNAATHYTYMCMQFACLAQWRMDGNKMRPSRLLKLYTMLALLISLGIFVHSLLFRYPYYHGAHNVLVETIDTIQLVSVRVTHIVSVLEALLKFKQSLLLFEKLQQVFDIFERQLNVPLNVGNMRATLLRPMIYLALTYTGSMGFVLSIKWIAPDPHILEYWYAYVPPFVVCALRYYQIGITIGLIENRLNELIALLHNINLQHAQQQHQFTTMPQYADIFSTEFVLPHKHQHQHQHKHNNTHTQPPSPPPPPLRPSHGRNYREQTQLRQLLLIRDVYNHLWELSTMVNSCFGLSLLANVGNDFVYLTSNCYWIFLNFSHYARNFHGILQLSAITAITMPHVYNVVALALKCERTIQTATGVALGLHRIDVDITNENNNALIEQFSLQLLHQKLQFSAAGFFKIDCSLLYTIIGATTTYLIILIQFYYSDGGRRN